MDIKLRTYLSNCFGIWVSGTILLWNWLIQNGDEHSISMDTVPQNTCINSLLLESLYIFKEIIMFHVYSHIGLTCCTVLTQRQICLLHTLRYAKCHSTCIPIWTWYQGREEINIKSNIYHHISQPVQLTWLYRRYLPDQPFWMIVLNLRLTRIVTVLFWKNIQDGRKRQRK